MKRCELCKEVARIHCESDQAKLCWDCDSKVHSANFLVAKHSRTLLCHVCQSPTLWSGSGANLGLSMSTCESCTGRGVGINLSGDRALRRDGNSTEDEYEEDDDDENSTEDEYEDEIGSDGESGDNQIVPWSSTPPPAASSSSSDDFFRRHNNGDGADSYKRQQRNLDSDLASDRHMSP